MNSFNSFPGPEERSFGGLRIPVEHPEEVVHLEHENIPTLEPMKEDVAAEENIPTLKEYALELQVPPSELVARVMKEYQESGINKAYLENVKKELIQLTEGMRDQGVFVPDKDIMAALHRKIESSFHLSLKTSKTA